MQDKVIVITGASAGIGAELARQVAAQGGAPVLMARRTEALEQVASECDGRALAVTGDVTRRADHQRVLASAVERFGHVDAWVNNAGRGISRLVSELTDEDVDEMMLVNVKSALYGMQTALEHFKARNAGHIVNVSSVLGRVPLAAVRSVYSAAKHALNALTSNLRMELREEYPAIHVSNVLPGVVATEFGIRARHGGIDSRQMPGAQPVEEVAAVIADVLAHPRAEAYSREEYHGFVAGYYAARDLAELEGRPPFVGKPPGR